MSKTKEDVLDQYATVNNKDQIVMEVQDALNMMEAYAEQQSVEFCAWKDRNYFRVDQNAYVVLYADITTRRFTYAELYTLFMENNLKEEKL